MQIDELRHLQFFFSMRVGAVLAEGARLATRIVHAQLGLDTLLATLVILFLIGQRKGGRCGCHCSGGLDLPLGCATFSWTSGVVTIGWTVEREVRRRRTHGTKG